MEDLKEMIIQTLDTSGVLDTLRAQLRSNVFKAIQGEEGKLPRLKSEATKALESDQGIIAAELFRDFLECFKMNYTLNVFLPECRLSQDKKPSSFLEDKLGLKGEPGIPMIFKLLQRAMETKDLPELKTSKPAPSLPPLKMPAQPQPKLESKPEPPKPAPQVKAANFGLSDEEDIPMRPSDSDEIELERKRLVDIEKKIKEMEGESKGRLMDIRLEVESSQSPEAGQYTEDFE
jgi:hypothetical protein